MSPGWDAPKRAASPGSAQGDSGTKYTVPAGAVFVPLLEGYNPHPTPSQHPHGRSSSDVSASDILPNPFTNVHPKADPGMSAPQLPAPAGWVGQPWYQRVKPLLLPTPPSPPPGILPSLPAPCQLPGANTSWGGRGGVKMLSGPGALLEGGGMLGVVGGRGLPTPQHPASPDGGSHPPARRSVLGGLGRLPAPPPPKTGSRGADWELSHARVWIPMEISGGAAC